MPFVNVKVIEGVFSAAQKQDIVRKVTDAMVEGENMRPVTWVVVEEVASGDWGIGGNPSRNERRFPANRSGRISEIRCGRASSVTNRRALPH
jgi:4-oxalocrotonate tautomerase